MKAWRGGWRFSHESCPRQTITSESKSGFKACPFFLNGKCCQQNWALSCRGQNQQLKDGWELEKREASLLPLWSAVQTCESDGEDANTSGLRTQRKQWVELGENPSATIPGGVSYFYFPPKAPRQVVVVQLLRCVWLFVTPWTAARQAPLSITISRSLLKLMSTELVMPSNRLILCHPLLLPSIFPSVRVFSKESALCIRCPKYWSFSFSISPFDDCSVLISFTIDWLDLLAVQGTLKSFLQHHSSKASLPSQTMDSKQAGVLDWEVLTSEAIMCVKD